MQIYNALDLKKGKVANRNKMGTLVRPVQFLSKDEKTEEWAQENLDWLEFEGMQQIRSHVKRLQKNYNLAEGIIDRSDYIVDEQNEYGELVELLTRDHETPFELKFYPIVPNIIRTLLGEFAKRTSRVQFRASDDISYNEMLEEKRKMVEEVLLEKARKKQMMSLMEMGAEMESEEAQAALAPEQLRSLPEIESFFQKDYQSLQERWANIQHRVDEDRFSMPELEMTAFKDMLVADREFWHFRMMEDDYEVELWDPRFTFYHKSPRVRYISQGNFVGKIELMTISDVIDLYGYLMTDEQMSQLEGIYPVHSAFYTVPGIQNDGSFYDASRSKEWNTNMPSLGMRQYLADDPRRRFSGDVIEQILRDSSDPFDYDRDSMVRVTTAYWKSQRKVGHLTKINDQGQVLQRVVTEDYAVTDKPLYDTSVIIAKTKDNLVFGEHIDWIWINDVWGGVKIGANRTTWPGYTDSSFEPVYLGIDKKTPSRLRFQFKGDNNLYGCKLPVEGRVFSDRNTRSTSLVDLVKPFQIQYNLVNNQIGDILVDELGTVIVIDQNALPRHSLGEDWGRNNLAKAYVAMKNFQMLPLDTTITNTENPLNFNHWQVLNLEQTNRLLGKVNLANYFREQAFEVIGISPQRRGQMIGRQTATGVEEGLAASYAQTEVYFIQHSDQLMPRVHQMRNDLAQYYNSNKPSIRLQYMTTLDEKVNFELFGTDLLLRDFNVYCNTKVNHREVMQQLRALAMNNNTTGASIYDLGNMIKAESISELEQTMKGIEAKTMAMRQQEMQQQQQLEQQRIEAEQQKQQTELNFRMEEAEKNRQRDLLVAEIRASGYGAAMDINSNQQSDYLDAMEQIRKQQQYQDAMNFKREQEVNKTQMTREQLNIKREELSARERIADKQVEIARVNKNKYDKPDKKKAD
jgi:hypothetical protein